MGAEKGEDAGIHSLIHIREEALFYGVVGTLPRDPSRRLRLSSWVLLMGM